MSFSVQPPGSITFSKYELNENELPSTGGTAQKSCFSYIEKISAVTNPVSLQHDVVYANAFAACLDRNNLHENESPLTLGCVGHQPDKEFPLESKTPVPLPLLMYPTETNGTTLHEVDMCAKPVLNWEAYIKDLKAPYRTVKAGKRCTNDQCEPTGDTLEEALESIPEEEVQESPGTSDEISMAANNKDKFTGSRRESKRKKPQTQISISDEHYSDTMNDDDKRQSGSYNLRERPSQLGMGGRINKTIIQTKSLRKMLPKQVEHASLSRKPKPSNQRNKNNDNLQSPSQSRRIDTLSIVSWRKLKNQPKLRIEGTWNHLYGGYNGSCCFMKTTPSRKLHLFLGKGSQLRAVELSEAEPSSIFSLKIDSVWDEDQTSLTFNAYNSTCDPFNELIFQIIPNEANQLLGLRRGRCIQIYNTAEDSPALLETIQNEFYGTSESESYRVNERTYVQNPLLRGFDFNPTFGPEVISIDENQVVRVCNIYKRATTDVFVLPSTPYTYKPENYPDFTVNEALGISFTNYGQLFYAWGDSVVYMGDRRARKYSRTHISPLFDLRNHVHMHSISSQNHFHETKTKLNEYISCVRKSTRDPYYYAGTTSKIYLMDLRVPCKPIIAVNHGLQSALTYMDIYSDLSGSDSLEKIFAGSQRSSETVCMLSDMGHMECLEKPGCKGRSPLLYSYPRHLLNPRSYFDAVVNEGYDFPFAVDHQLVKNHCYAWPTGLATYPINSKDSSVSNGMIVVSSNNYGDVFWQEWGKKPLSSHRRIDFSHYKLKTFLAGWHNAMTRKALRNNVQKVSKNSKNPVDCTIFIEPLAKEIEKLNKVRDSPFNCFKPDEIEHHSKIRTITSISELCKNLSKYESPLVEGILNVWSGANEHQDTEPIGVEVKIEPQEWHAPISPNNTIEIDLTDYDEEQTNEQGILMTANSIRNSLDIDQGRSLESFMQSNQESREWTEFYSDVFGGSQPLNPNDEDEIQESYFSQPSSAIPKPKSSLKNVKKSRRSGFL